MNSYYWSPPEARVAKRQILGRSVVVALLLFAVMIWGVSAPLH